MSLLLTKYQSQELGNALLEAEYDPSAFIRKETPATDEQGESSITLTNRDTSDNYTITFSGDWFAIAWTVPGTTRIQTRRTQNWDTVVSGLRNWAAEVKLESEAIDPWEQEAEDMANDDSYFTLSEIPRVDQAIDDSLEELKGKAVEHGIAQSRIEAELQKVSASLKSAARSSTKKEWIALFRGLIIEKLFDWGMQTELVHHIVQTLITSAHDITQLVAHATRLLPG